MPLSAAATRAALADETLNPDIVAANSPQVVHVTLRMGAGITVAPDGLRTLLRRAFGGATEVRAHQSGMGATSPRQGKQILHVLGRDAAAKYGRERAQYLPNPYFLTDVSGWTGKELTGASQVSSGGETVARSTAQRVIGPASALVTTNGSAANEGISMAAVSDPYLPAGGAASASVRFGGFVRSESGTSNVRCFVDEFQADGTTFVARTTGTSTAPSTTWQELTGTRVCTRGNKLRAGIEKVGTVAESFYVAGMHLFDASAGNTLYNVAIPNEAAGYAELEFDLVFDGVRFMPEALYDALDFTYPTISTMRDQLSHGIYTLTID